MGSIGFGEVAERLRRSTVQVVDPGRPGGGGSGIIWSEDGTIVTNAHVARGSRAAVTLWDGRTLDAAVTARDTRRDVAALQVDASGLPAAAIGDSNALRVGELVIAVGNPLGFIGAMTTGVVHALNPNWVQADVRLAPGNSGGPLADAQGRVIGINTMIAGGLGLAVPSNAARDFLRAPSSSGTPLGVVVRPVELKSQLGFLVLEVEPRSPADVSSLLIGDVLVGEGGRRFESLQDLSVALARGGVARLQFQRGGGATREVAVRLRGAAREAA